MEATNPTHSLEDPFAPPSGPTRPVRSGGTLYDEAIGLGEELLAKPTRGGGLDRVRVQHAKGRMTVFERIRVLTDREPNLMWQNWGPNLDGASLVCGILDIGGRDVAVYGHDFTLRAGSMDATNGNKLARLIYMAGERGIPLIGMNDSAGAFVPAGVGGLDGYSEAFTALRKISGVVPSLSLMFGYNAGGGSYLPRQGSFMIQCEDTFIGLTGPGVVKSVLGEDVSADNLGGPGVHGLNGVCDVTTADDYDVEPTLAPDELAALVLGGLRPEYRDVVVAYHLEEKTVAEIAAELHIAQDTVYTRLRRARKAMLAVLREHGHA